MRNPWRMQDGPDNKINRNNFPMSFQYNGTFKYGKIYPIGLIRTIPGASYQIDSTLALNFMPTAFPIQTRQRAYVHFFYGRDRNFWKDYKDFVNGMNPDLVKPYLDESVTKARTGNLLDYLGVPTTIVGSYASYRTVLFDNTGVNEGGFKMPAFVASNSPTCSLTIPFNAANAQINLPMGNIQQFMEDKPNLSNYFPSFNVGLPSIENYPYQSQSSTDHTLCYVATLNDETISNIRMNVAFTESLGEDVNSWLSGNFFDSSDSSRSYYSYFQERYKMYLIGAYDSEDNLIGYITPSGLSNQGEIEFTPSSPLNHVSKLVVYFPEILSLPDSNGYNKLDYLIVKDNSLVIFPTKLSVESSSLSTNTGTVKDIDENTSPYWRGGTVDSRKRIKLNAIPCRMYETIYNLYYRNPQNNPYILNGKPEYNVFIPTKDGGVDDNLYELRYRNWEDDFLTTAVQTPQQGIAPLVGLTDRGATVTLTNEDGSVTRYKTNLDEYGNVTGIETTDSSEPLLTQALIDAVSYGISIEDLRNVNAMQKWLELNLRKGYQYKDIIEARWGISISYNELDLPEFIGGFTQEVGLQAVTQTTSHGEGVEGALGWQAGRMYAAGSGRSITHYCEEEGYIMALLTVVPVPNYSQLLPKHWFTRDLLDSYQPEFNHIGFQPITYKEVCPIQAYQESTENVDVLEQTFGYQRPWYEYFNQVDEVHGQFRTTFKDFLINRTFNVKPELSESFLLVDPEQVNDVFAVTTDDDKILGAINHRIVAKLPISLYAQARLE